MRLLPGPSSSSEEVDDSSTEGPPCHCPSSLRSPRVPSRHPLSRAALWFRPRRRCFCLAICLTVVALVANFTLFFIILDILLALLRRKCADNGNGQQKTMGQISQSDQNIVKQTLANANNGTENANDSRTNNTSELATVNRQFAIPSASSPIGAIPSASSPIGAIPSASSPIGAIPSASSPIGAIPSASSPIGAIPSASSPIPLTSTRLRLNVSRSSKYFSSLPLASSATTASPRIRVTATDRMALARQRVPAHAKLLSQFPQKGDHSVTVVTALLDIGRDRWRQYGRTLRQYHQFMRNLLQLRVPMIVIVDEKSAEFVHRERARINWGQWTKIVQLSLDQLPLAIFQKRISLLMDSELANWPSDWDLSMRSHPEATQAEYVVVVNSKPYFLAQAATDNPFGTEFFVWLDAGYGHGDRAVFPPSWEWRPTFPRGKMSVIKLTPPRDLLSRYSLKQLYRQDVAVLSGGFLAGDRRAVTQLHREHHRMFLELLEKGRVDDDQTFLVLLVNQNPPLFNIVNGDWFDAFKAF
ncbi:hypothetical protein niasHT_038019 [Heterodera trifolii]|uniref:Uncharacterized protein n=1 Tax=Heterodera trifolii TaxID=157864 RepID=A0ABD2HMZ5_9BILA